jgi:hypothetical protein
MLSNNLEIAKNILMNRICENCYYSYFDTNGYCYKHRDIKFKEQLSCESWRLNEYEPPKTRTRFG